MYCRKCINESKENREKEPKKVNMDVDIEGQFYICPECGHIVNWNTEEE